MSKKYQYFAKKRNSHWYFEASTPCKFRCQNNYIICHVCLRKSGRTRNIQKQNNF